MTSGRTSTRADRPLRVTTLIDSLAAGTAQRAAVEIACALDRARYAPHVLVSRGDGPLVELLEAADVPHTILQRRDALDGARWRRAHRDHVVHADLLHSHAREANARAARLARSVTVPLIAHEHEAGEQPWPARRSLPRRRLARHASRVVCTSEQLAALERASGIPGPLIDVVPAGIHVNAALPRTVARAQLGLVDRSFTVGILADETTEPVHAMLVEAVASLARIGRDVRLCVIGSEAFDATLRLHAGALGIASRVTWVEGRADGARLVAAFDAGVSTIEDGRLTRTALETMAARVPLVATRPLGSGPTPLDDGSGLLVPRSDPLALGTAIAALMDDEQHRAVLARRGARSVRETHSFDAMLERIEGIYQDVTREAA